MKVGDLVRHTPWTDRKAQWMDPEFQRGIIVEKVENLTEVHFLVAHSEKMQWYRETELEDISGKKKIQRFKAK